VLAGSRNFISWQKHDLLLQIINYILIAWEQQLMVGLNIKFSSCDVKGEGTCHKTHNLKICFSHDQKTSA